MLNKTMGETIQSYRESIKMTRHKVSIIGDVAEETVKEIENDNQFPRVETLCNICRAMKCTPNDLIPEWMYK